MFMLQPFVIKFRKIFSTLSCFNIISLKRYLLIVFSLAFFQCLALPANSYSASFTLISGSHTGTTLYAQLTAVTPSDNPGTNASGVISTGSECKIGDTEWPHFHGSLYGEPDPEPTGCGHGRVVKSVIFGDSVLTFIAAAMGMEAELVNNTSSFYDLHYIYVSIKDLKRAIKEAGNATPPNQQVIDLLKSAIAYDLKAIRTFKNGDVSAAKGFLKEALDKKSAAYQLFVLSSQ